MKDEIITILNKYDKPITSTALLLELKGYEIHLSDPQLRQQIQEIIMEQNILIYSCNEGFAIARTEEEYTRGIAWLQYRLKPLNDRIKRMNLLLCKNFGSQIEMRF